MIDPAEASISTAPRPPAGRRPVHLNSEVDWDTFDPELYRDHNYRQLHGDDHQIMVRMREHFAEVDPGRRVPTFENDPARPATPGTDAVDKPHAMRTVMDD